MLPKFKKLPLLVMLYLIGVMPGATQNVAVKSNILGWAAGGTINAGIEAGTGRKVTLQAFGAINPWTYSGERRVRIWNVEPEIRYWFCQKFNGHFIGVHLLGGEYNIRNVDLPFKTLPHQIKGRHYEGWYIGAGITYGYQWVLSDHWNLEASVGVGYARSPYRLYGRCQRVLERDTRHYVGPTKLALSMMYCF
jgi:hypothetical protein